jgi:opacity protein-like surface antigen
MKRKITLALSVLLACALGANAQERGFYIKPTGSYFLKVAPVEFPALNGEPARKTIATLNPSTGALAVQSQTALTGSFGEGWRAGLVGGFRFSEVVGFEVGLNYYQSTTQDMMVQQFSVGSNPVFERKTTGEVKAFDVAPALVLHVPTYSAFKPYAKVGFILPVGGYLVNKSEITDRAGILSSEFGLTPGQAQSIVLSREEEVRANPTIGFQSALGFDLNAGGRVNFFAEIEYRNIAVGSKEKELTKFEGEIILADNTSRPITFDNAQEGTRTVNYHKTITSDMNVEGSANYDHDRPSDDLRSYINIGGLGFNIGVKIPLGR